MDRRPSDELAWLDARIRELAARCAEAHPDEQEILLEEIPQLTARHRELSGLEPKPPKPAPHPVEPLAWREAESEDEEQSVRLPPGRPPDLAAKIGLGVALLAVVSEKDAPQLVVVLVSTIHGAAP